MPNQTLLSSTEHKLLLAFFLFICGVFYLHAANNLIENHNHAVRIEQEDKLRLADNGATTSMFSVCFFSGPPVFIYLFWLQIFTGPALFLFLRKNNSPRFVAVFIHNSVTFLSLLAWNKQSYETYLWREHRFPDEIPKYLDVGSNQTALLLFFLLFVFLSVQFFVIARFGIEKFPAKISLR